MITAIRRGLNVKRFHTVQRITEETVGHHSANVAHLLLRLDPNCRMALLVAALSHDIPECYTGDVPAPCKWDNPHIKAGLEECDEAYMKQYDIPWPELEPEEKVLLKLADMLDLVLSSIEEMNKGNSYARQLVSNGQEYILGMGLAPALMEKVNEIVNEVKVDVR